MEPVEKYLKEIQKNLSAGNATEHTHRPALKTLVESLSPKVTATNEPKREECGAPDYVISKNTKFGPLTIGYVEAKDTGKSLSESAKTDQIKRYLSSLPNLILTNYLEFRLYEEGKLKQSALLATVDEKSRLKAVEDGRENLENLLKNFLEHEPSPVATPRELALRLARLTHMTREIIIESFEKGKATATLRDLRKAFAEILIPDLEQPDKAPEFADMFAQTIGYGLFAARCNHTGAAPFQRTSAAAEIPKTNPFLRKLFGFITGADFDDEPYAGFVDDITRLLAHSDIDAILDKFGKRSRREDPIIHFYETFLTSYDQKLRKVRGIYYTPEPVVSYIVRSVDQILKEKFDCPDGLADTAQTELERKESGKRKTEKTSRVLILDPACGTGTFLYSTIDYIREQFMTRGNAGLWPGYVKNHLLSRLFGFELIMTPYAVAHLKLAMQLAAQDLPEEARKAWAYDFESGDRLGIYLTNTLEEAVAKSELLMGKWIADEANAASQIKSELPIMVVIGNPPYSGHSANRGEYTKTVLKGEKYQNTYEIVGDKIVKGKFKTARNDTKVKFKTFIGELMLDYFTVDGDWLKERNPKWLQDDYVKFIRFGQWRIEKTGAGILAFITNHGYLDNPTFRGMRQQLMRTFTDIYIIDLHGNAKKKEICPDGSQDKNVFDIQQGVAIGIFVKEPGGKGPAKVHHSELWGSRENKFKSLNETDVKTTDWTDVKPKKSFYSFTPSISKLDKEYEKWRSIKDIFPVNSLGIITARDHFTIQFSEDDVMATVNEFSKLSVENARERFNIGEDVGDWKVSLAQKDILENEISENKIIEILYRPFDTRYTYYTGRSRGFICRPRYEVMKHMLSGENLALCTTRLIEIGRGFEHVFCSSSIIESHAASLKEVNYLFPLFLYPNNNPNHKNHQTELIDISPWPADDDGRIPNLDPKFVSELEKSLKMSFTPNKKGNLKKTFGPEDIFNYIYAILNSPTYRQRYQDFLKIDFPRIPLTSNAKLFRSLCSKGNDLVNLHLCAETPLLYLDRLITKYPVKGDDIVEDGHPRYIAPGEKSIDEKSPLKKGRVYISRTDFKSNKEGQFFDGVPPEVWDFHIGGYQVCEKWLKDRRGRQLSFDELLHYQKIIVAVKETIRLMEEIDNVISSWPIK